MENNTENKAKFFAQYWGQEVLKYPGLNPVFEIQWQEFNPHIENEEIKPIQDGYLELKPLSSITDEDAIEVSSLLTQEKYIVVERTDQYISLSKGKYDFFIWFDGEILFNNDNASQLPLERMHVYDFFRLNGFALPWNGISVQEQIERGWVKLN